MAKKKPDPKEEVISHLQIMHTWAAFALEKGQGFFERQHYENIMDWTLEAVDALTEQEHKDKMYHALEEDWKALLKEQEPVEPLTYYDLFICPVCKNALFRGQKFCYECGRAVKW